MPILGVILAPETDDGFSSQLRTSNIKSIKLRKTVKEAAQSSPLFAYQRRERRSWLLLLFVAKKATLADDLRHLRWHHLFPALVPAGDALEHVT
jgi:hypothetical protein